MKNEKYITHNASLFKPVKVDSSKINEDREDDDLSSENDDNQITQNPNSPQSNARENADHCNDILNTTDN